MKYQYARLLLCCSLSIFYFISAGQATHPLVIQKDIVYGHAGGVDLKMDMGIPGGIGPFPVVLFFHGGGWQQGDKWHMHRWIEKFAAAGYAGVSVGYRFAPRFQWPAQVHDAKQAVRYLRTHASEFNIDTSRIGVMGESAGGYLALMVGLTSPKDSLEGESDLAGTSSRVQAVVSYFSATDFRLPRKPLDPEVQKGVEEYYGKPLTQVITDFTGAKSPEDPILEKISVIHYADKGDPPVLMFQGDNDPFVATLHAFKLQEALEAAKVPNKLVIVPGAGHGWTGKPEEKTTLELFAFLDGLFRKTR